MKNNRALFWLSMTFAGLLCLPACEGERTLENAAGAVEYPLAVSRLSLEKAYDSAKWLFYLRHFYEGASRPGTPSINWKKSISCAAELDTLIPRPGGAALVFSLRCPLPCGPGLGKPVFFFNLHPQYHPGLRHFTPAGDTITVTMAGPGKVGSLSFSDGTTLTLRPTQAGGPPELFLQGALFDMKGRKAGELNVREMFGIGWARQSAHPWLKERAIAYGYLKPDAEE
jgi:hypothetical protein